MIAWTYNCRDFSNVYFVLQVGVEVAHPGIANDFGDVDARKYYTYYQWVCFVLFFQVSALLFFLSFIPSSSSSYTLAFHFAQLYAGCKDLRPAAGAHVRLAVFFFLFQLCHRRFFVRSSFSWARDARIIANSRILYRPSGWCWFFSSRFSESLFFVWLYDSYFSCWTISSIVIF